DKIDVGKALLAFFEQVYQVTPPRNAFQCVSMRFNAFQCVSCVSIRFMRFNSFHAFQFVSCVSFHPPPGEMKRIGTVPSLGGRQTLAFLVGNVFGLNSLPFYTERPVATERPTPEWLRDLNLYSEFGVTPDVHSALYSLETRSIPLAAEATDERLHSNRAAHGRSERDPTPSAARFGLGVGSRSRSLP